MALTPLLLVLVATGTRSLPRWFPHWPLAAVAVGAGCVGIANLHVTRDVVDPARYVRWDEAARMLAVLADGDATVISRPFRWFP